MSRQTSRFHAIRTNDSPLGTILLFLLTSIALGCIVALGVVGEGAFDGEESLGIETETRIEEPSFSSASSLGSLGTR